MNPHAAHKPADYRADIDGLRAIAIIAVVAFHAFPLLVTGGFIGVDIFFVISGYLISGISLRGLQSGNFRFSDFYLRRIKRLCPALIAVFVATYISGWLILLPDDFKHLGKNIAGGSVFIANVVQWQESNYFELFIDFKPLRHLWSLGVEEQFYLLWPALLYCMWKRRSNLLTFTLAIAITSFTLNVFWVNDYRLATFYLPATRLWELLAGAVLPIATLYNKSAIVPPPRAAANILALLSLLILLVAMVGITDGMGFPGWEALLPVIGAFLLISLPPDTLVHRHLLSNPLMVWIGMISYPLYLWHWPMLSYLHIFYPDNAPPLYLTGTIAASVLLAWLTYRFIECPIRFGQLPRVAIIKVFVLMEIMGTIGLITYMADGFAFREPEGVRDFVNAIGYPYGPWRAGTCYLDPAKEKFDAMEGCIEGGDKPLVLLWGDSHGASLYPGLKALEDQYDFRLAEFTTSSCPPLLGYQKDEYKYCKPNNDAIFSLIKRIHPDIVLLQARWDFIDVPKLEQTLSELQKVSGTRVVVVGPTPRWKYSLYTLAKIQLVTDRMADLCPDNVPQNDAQLRTITQKYGSFYASPYHALCNDKGCLMRGQGKDGHAFVFDSDHLSPQGSVFTLRQMADEIFEGTRVKKK